jgi:NADPH-dependent ferric siderophore reductase
MPSVERITHPLQPRMLQVRKTRGLTPSLRRVTLVGNLSGFSSLSPDDHVKLIFPRPGEPEPVLPRLSNGWLRPDAAAPRPVMRDYTPRRFDVAAGELVVDFVLHGDGPATRWATTAAPGGRIGQAGPPSSHVVSDDFAWWLLAGDETAIPAIARRLDELPAGARVFVVIEVQDPTGEIALPTTTALDLRWVHRGTAAPGSSDALERAIGELELPAGDGFAWVGAEAEVARRLREQLRVGRALPKAYTKVTAYWKRGVADHHEQPDE